MIKFSSQLSKMKEKCCKVSYYCLSINTYEILKSDKIPLAQMSFDIIFELYKLEDTVPIFSPEGLVLLVDDHDPIE